MKTPFWKQLVGVLFTGFQPSCSICGSSMQVGELWNDEGTEFCCPNYDNPDHLQIRDMMKKWQEKIKSLEAEIEMEDQSISPNHNRQRYGSIKLELKRKQKE